MAALSERTQRLVSELDGEYQRLRGMGALIGKKELLKEFPRALKLVCVSRIGRTSDCDGLSYSPVTPSVGFDMAEKHFIIHHHKVRAEAA
ncbi:hypothetical protein HY407_03280 [Candidatus Gottesmanbacteria bacterium]|nr:hypothetical protein [Candidatus Gottesmanbacteria bacterium]